MTNDGRPGMFVRGAVFVAVLLFAIALIGFSDAGSWNLTQSAASQLARLVLVLSAALLLTCVLVQLSSMGQRPVSLAGGRVYDAWVLVLILLNGPIAEWNQLVAAAGFPSLLHRHRVPMLLSLTVLAARVISLHLRARSARYDTSKPLGVAGPPA